MALIDISGTGAQRKLHSDGRDSSYVAVIAYELEFSDRQRRSWIQLMRPDFKSSTKSILRNHINRYENVVLVTSVTYDLWSAG